MATENNDLPVRLYQKQFIGLMQTVFGVQSTFTPTFGALQALDAVQNNAIAFSVKANDVPVAVGTYNTDADVAFGSGTSNSNRFGPMKEIVYGDIDVPYSFGWSFNEGIDQLTVNTDLNSAVADRLNLQAQAKTRMFNSKLGAYLVASAAADLGAVTDVNKVFEEASERYTDLEVVVPVRAYVTAEVYNAIIDHQLVTTSKGSAVNIDENGIMRFRDIVVTKTPARYMLVRPSSSRLITLAVRSPVSMLFGRFNQRTSPVLLCKVLVRLANGSAMTTVKQSSLPGRQQRPPHPLWHRLPLLPLRTLN
ncbi:phage capsid protein [Lacticaseibacillus manihotivorans]|uniref:phage capsid protein n=1 Tax=Lacticaseibacillus manihotivorans TaxID=88233 RepID=UPI000A83AC8C